MQGGATNMKYLDFLNHWWIDFGGATNMKYLDLSEPLVKRFWKRAACVYMDLENLKWDKQRTNVTLKNSSNKLVQLITTKLNSFRLFVKAIIISLISLLG